MRIAYASKSNHNSLRRIERKSEYYGKKKPKKQFLLYFYWFDPRRVFTVQAIRQLPLVSSAHQKLVVGRSFFSCFLHVDFASFPFNETLCHNNGPSSREGQILKFKMQINFISIHFDGDDEIYLWIRIWWRVSEEIVFTNFRVKNEKSNGATHNGFDFVSLRIFFLIRILLLPIERRGQPVVWHRQYYAKLKWTEKKKW